MERRVLIPLDGSAVAEAILPHAERFARLTGSSLILLHVVTDAERSQTDFWVAAAPADIRRQWEQSALTGVHTYLAAIARRLQLAGLSVSTELVMAEDAAAAIAARAHHDPEVVLLAMSTHGRGGLGRWVLGSVAAQVLRVAQKPMLMLRARAGAAFYESMQPYHTILTPLDGSSLAEQALAQLRIIAGLGAATLVLVGVPLVRDDRELDEAEADRSIVDLAHDQDDGSLPSYLRQAARRQQADGFATRARLATGPTAEAILRVSAKEHADLIVMALGGPCGLNRLFLGSEVEELVRHSDVPVIIVPVHHIMSTGCLSKEDDHADHNESTCAGPSGARRAGNSLLDASAGRDGQPCRAFE